MKAEGLLEGDALTSVTLGGAKTDAGVYRDCLTVTAFQINGDPGAESRYEVILVPGDLTITPRLKSISIATPPDKTVYHEGEGFESAGLVVEAVYDTAPGKTATVTLAGADAYRFTPAGPLAPSDKEVELSFRVSAVPDITETRTVRQAVTVKAHAFEWVTDREPTCGEPGTKHEECKACGAKRNEYTEIEATGQHVWEWVTDTEPSGGQPGTKHEECKVCGAKRNEDAGTQEDGEHSPGEKKTENEKKPTCTEDGSHDEVVYCKDCGKELSRKTVIDKATGHTPGERKIEGGKEPTCTEDSIREEVVYCETCGEEISRDPVTFKATGHAWGEWKVTREPTDTDKGEEQRVCANDPTHIETREIASFSGSLYTVSDNTVRTWETGSGLDFVIIVHRSEDDGTCFDHYLETRIDGERTTVEAKAGSTIVTIPAETLEALGTGIYTVTIRFDDGEAEMSLAIGDEAEGAVTPPTGDGSHPALWYALALGSLAGIAALAVYGKKRAAK